MKLPLTFSFWLAIASITFSQSDDDAHYVWAQSGLNMRMAPSSTAEKIAKLKFGDKVELLNETDIPYNEYCIKKSPNEYESQHPYILKGKWVYVNYAGQKGYVIDQYLLPIEPSERTIYDWKSTLLLDIKKLDTLEIQSYSGQPLKTITYYNHNITQSHETLACGFDQRILLPDFTLEKAFVLFTTSLRNGMDKIYVKKYWPNELLLQVPNEVETEIKFIVDTTGVEIIHR